MQIRPNGTHSTELRAPISCSSFQMGSAILHNPAPCASFRILSISPVQRVFSVNASIVSPQAAYLSLTSFFGAKARTRAPRTPTAPGLGQSLTVGVAEGLALSPGAPESVEGSNRTSSPVSTKTRHRVTRCAGGSVRVGLRAPRVESVPTYISSRNAPAP